MNRNDKFRSYIAVCPDNYFFKIACCCFGLIFNYHPVEGLVILRFPCQFYPNIFTRFRGYFCDPERVHRKYINLFTELFSGFSIEADISPGYAHEFHNISNYTELHDPVNRIVGMDFYEVTQLSATISGRINPNRYPSLASSGDLPLMAGGRTPSVGLDALNNQRRVTFVLKSKNMDNLPTIHHGREFIPGFRNKNQG